MRGRSRERDFAGSALKSGVICFVPLGGTKGPAALATVQDGHYELSKTRGPVVGRQRVEIDAAGSDDDPVAGAPNREAARAEYFKRNAAKWRRTVIPKRYNRQSTLTVAIAKDGENAFDFRIDGTSN